LQQLQDDKDSYRAKLSSFQRLPTIELLIDEIESLA
jgi:hypothetical protein